MYIYIYIHIRRPILSACAKQNSIDERSEYRGSPFLGQISVPGLPWPCLAVPGLPWPTQAVPGCIRFRLLSKGFETSLTFEQRVRDFGLSSRLLSKGFETLPTFEQRVRDFADF